MEDINTPENQAVLKEDLIIKNKKPKWILIMVGVGILIVIGLLLFFAKGLFVAATVNGMPISRLSVVRELEKQSGKQALDALIQRKLMENEFNKKGINITQQEVDDQIKKIEAQVTSQGGTLKNALVTQGMTETQLREQITIQKKIEKLLADKVQVSSQEIDAYIKDNKAVPPKDVNMEDFRKQISDQLTGQKLQQEAQTWIAGLTKSAKINYYVNY